MFRSQPFLSSMPTIGKFIIHPPLPLNTRESKQLLTLLTTSFRKQLDAAHGVPDAFRANVQPGRSSGSRQLQHTKRRRHSDSDAGTPTDLHLNSILSNPLFKTPTTHGQRKRDPMRTFESAVSKGMMTLHHAKLCLEAENREILRSPTLSIRDTMRESGAARKVLSWLLASGQINDNKFLNNHGFIEILMQFMVAEGLQEVAWKWVYRSFQELDNCPNLTRQERRTARRNATSTFMLLVKAEAHLSDNLQSAYTCLTKIAKYLSLGTYEGVEKFLVTEAVTFYLIRSITDCTYRQTMPESTFESFIILMPEIVRHPEHNVAHLNLFHPSRPSAILALSYLAKLDSTLLRDSEKKRTLELALNAARFLFEHEQVEDANWIMLYLQRNYADTLGIQENSLVEQAKEQASNLELLEGLGLA